MNWKIIGGLFICIILFVAVVFFIKQNSVVSSKTVLQTIIKTKENNNQSGYNPKLPTVDQVFSDDHNWVATLPAERKRVMIATGDVIPARSVNFQVLKFNDFDWPYRKTYDFVKNADVTFINLETPLIHDCPATVEGMVFCGDERNVEGLVYAGVDVASLANNHAGNHGVGGVDKTEQLLNTYGIAVTGVHGPLYKDIRGIKFAFLGYNDITTPQPGVANAEEDKIKKEIKEAKKKADVVVVTYHWGVEYRDQPDDRQKYLGHFTIDAGVDLVIGNHPHRIQPIEIYKGKLITYAHGNYVFDQMWSQETREGVIGKYTFYDNQLVDVQYFPLQIDDYGQPHFVDDGQKQKILGNMKQQSIILASEK